MCYVSFREGSQIGSSPQVGVKIENIWNHNPDYLFTFSKWQKHDPKCGVFLHPLEKLAHL